MGRLPSQIPRITKPPTVTVIGAGNWGTTLALALDRAGVPLREIVKHRKSRSQSVLVRAVQARATKLSEAKLDADVLWICTPDATIRAVAADLAARLATIQAAALKHGRRNSAQHAAPVVFHSSGALASSELDVLRKTGASVASVHPLMTFPATSRFQKKKPPHSLAGVPFAIEGDTRAQNAARKLIRALGGEPFVLSAKNKAIYHAFSTFASPMLVVLLTVATETAALAGYSPAQARRRMRPIVDRTIANFFAGGPQKSFSGPIARGDWATVARHLDALSAHPGIEAIYRALSRHALHALPSRNRRQIAQALNPPPTRVSYPRKIHSS